jgi:hypothetical protein
MATFEITDPADYFDATGNSMKRRLNWSLFFIFGGVCLLIAILVLVIIQNKANGDIADALGSARQQFSTLQSLIEGRPIAAAAISTSQFYQCTPGLSVPRRWIIIGSSYAKGQGSSFTWYQQISVETGATVLVPAGVTIEQQMASLQNNTEFLTWVNAGDPLMVIVEHGYYESMAALAVQLGELESDSRALAPVMISMRDHFILQQSWWRGPEHRIVFLVPTLPYAPLFGGFVYPTTQMCTDPLSSAIFNHAHSYLTMKAVADLSSTILMTHSLAIIMSQNSPTPPSAHFQVLTTDHLYTNFGFNTASSILDLAFNDDCLSLSTSGQRLLAHFLLDCVNGKDYKVPQSLLDA